MTAWPQMCRLCRACAGLCAGCFIGVPGVPGPLRAHAHVKKQRTTTPHKHALVRICTRHTRHTRHMHDSYTHFAHAPGTGTGTPGTRARLPIFYHPKEKMMEAVKTKTIRCTPENARDMQQMVKQWPELHALVQHLQAQDLFPGLRALTVTLTGSDALLGKGLAAVAEINATRRD